MFFSNCFAFIERHHHLMCDGYSTNASNHIAHCHHIRLQQTVQRLLHDLEQFAAHSEIFEFENRIKLNRSARQSC